LGQYVPEEELEVDDVDVEDEDENELLTGVDITQQISELPVQQKRHDSPL